MLMSELVREVAENMPTAWFDALYMLPHCMHLCSQLTVLLFSSTRYLRF
jgi:hypothetical protein